MQIGHYNVHVLYKTTPTLPEYACKPLSYVACVGHVSTSTLTIRIPIFFLLEILIKNTHLDRR
jgi:hypothetical protein